VWNFAYHEYPCEIMTDERCKSVILAGLTQAHKVVLVVEEMCAPTSQCWESILAGLLDIVEDVAKGGKRSG
jgi:hypothetical protein